MRIKVSFLGATRDYSTSEVCMIEVDSPSTVADAVKMIIKDQPKIETIGKYLFISVNAVLVPRNFQLSEGDEISLFFRPGGG